MIFGMDTWVRRCKATALTPLLIPARPSRRQMSPNTAHVEGGLTPESACSWWMISTVFVQKPPRWGNYSCPCNSWESQLSIRILSVCIIEEYVSTRWQTKRIYAPMVVYACAIPLPIPPNRPATRHLHRVSTSDAVNNRTALLRLRSMLT